MLLPESCDQVSDRDVVTCEGASWTVRGQTLHGRFVGTTRELAPDYTHVVDTAPGYALDDHAYTDGLVGDTGPITLLGDLPDWLGGMAIFVLAVLLLVAAARAVWRRLRRPARSAPTGRGAVTSRHQ